MQANRRALISLYILIALLAFTALGPVVWDVNPAAQDVEQISQPPGAPRAATIVEPYRPWDGADAGTTSGELQLAQSANSQSVRLLWNADARARSYRIYRNIFPIGPDGALGLPLGENFGTQNTRYEDRLDLIPRSYYYSVVSFAADGTTINTETLAVEVTRVLTVKEAMDRNLVAQGERIVEGDIVYLALHPLGTDYLGRDLLSRLMYGARVSLFIGIVAPFLFVVFGVVYGSAAGFLGGKWDQAFMRFADFVVALPFLLFMILFKISFGIGPGESGIVPMLLAMVLLLWPSTARLVRGQILQIRGEGYISASRLLGAKTSYLVLRHMIPNTMGVILVTLTFAVPSAIFTEAFLSFIGMGVAPPTPSWGSMCNEGIKTMLTTPHELIFPALFISVTVLAFNLLGDGLRDALDARMRSTE